MTIIGAGVIGLAIAAELSKKDKNIVVLEKNKGFGQETSSRNSEVIHSGVYYPLGSLKARLCVEGARLLYEICEKFSIPYKRLGKMIVATEVSELKPLEKLFQKGMKNNVSDLRILDKEEARKVEPHTNALAAIYSPCSGIIDSHSLMKHFFDFAKDNGAMFSFNSEVESLRKGNDGFVVGVKQEKYRFNSEVVINCAGLSSDYIAALAGIDIDKESYRLKLCKGTYFSYSKPSPVNTLVYPLPDDGLTGLGIHATLDLGGRLRFGPDVEYVDSLDYQVDIAKRNRFYAGASRIIPGLAKEAFAPDQAGIRPKLYGSDEEVRDFVISDEKDSGFKGLINLIGIESPGLTAAPAIARMVCGMIFRN